MNGKAFGSSVNPSNMSRSKDFMAGARVVLQSSLCNDQDLCYRWLRVEAGRKRLTPFLTRSLIVKLLLGHHTGGLNVDIPGAAPVFLEKAFYVKFRFKENIRQ
jgi:hypothetical protein